MFTHGENIKHLERSINKAANEKFKVNSDMAKDSHNITRTDYKLVYTSIRLLKIT